MRNLLNNVILCICRYVYKINSQWWDCCFPGNVYVSFQVLPSTGGINLPWTSNFHGCLDTIAQQWVLGFPILMAQNWYINSSNSYFSCYEWTWAPFLCVRVICDSLSACDQHTSVVLMGFPWGFIRVLFLGTRFHMILQFPFRAIIGTSIL